MPDGVPETRLNISDQSAEKSGDLSIGNAKKKPIEVIDEDGHKYFILASISSDAQQALDIIMGKRKPITKKPDVEIKPLKPIGMTDSTVDQLLTDSHHGQVQS